MTNKIISRIVEVAIGVTVWTGFKSISWQQVDPYIVKGTIKCVDAGTFKTIVDYYGQGVMDEVTIEAVSQDATPVYYLITNMRIRTSGIEEMTDNLKEVVWTIDFYADSITETEPEE